MLIWMAIFYIQPKVVFHCRLLVTFKHAYLSIYTINERSPFLVISFCLTWVFNAIYSAKRAFNGALYGFLDASMYHEPTTCNVILRCLACTWSRLHVLEVLMYVNTATCNVLGGRRGAGVGLSQNYVYANVTTWNGGAIQVWGWTSCVCK